MMFDRPRERERLNAALGRAPVVLLTGARQVGKTTLARSLMDAGSVNYFDLENPVDLARLAQPMTALSSLCGLIVIDEVQRHPELFPVLRVLVDRDDQPATFLILGSASIHALKQSSESLAGRLEIMELQGFGAADPVSGDLDILWLRGGYPRSLFADNDNDSFHWRSSYITTLTTRDLPGLGMRLAAHQLHRFLMLTAHYHANLWNASHVARDAGMNVGTLRNYLDILHDALIIRILQPWWENTSKRLVKTPKVYFQDTGIVHALLGITTTADLHTSMYHGATWESLVIDEILRRTPHNFHPYFWRTSNGAELDLLLISGSERIGIEIKRVDAPRLTPSMKSAFTDLNLTKLWVIYPGTKKYSLADTIATLPFTDLLNTNAITALH